MGKGWQQIAATTRDERRGWMGGEYTPSPPLTPTTGQEKKDGLTSRKQRCAAAAAEHRTPKLTLAAAMRMRPEAEKWRKTFFSCCYGQPMPFTLTKNYGCSLSSSRCHTYFGGRGRGGGGVMFQVSKTSYRRRHF